MPKKTDYPRLRTHVRKGNGGRVHVYWFYDMRREGKPDIPLGKDRSLAIAKWEEIHLKKPRIAGRVQEGINRWLEDAVPGYTNKGTRRNYTANMVMIGEVFGMMAWDEVTLPMLRKFLTSRKHRKGPDKGKPAPTTANREMAAFQVMWNWAKIEGLHRSVWPAAGMERAKWKNREQARRYTVTNEVFDAIYAEAEPMLRDCMDLASATGMRLTDCRTVTMPAGDLLRLEANKTGKDADFDLSLSQVLPELIARRRALKAPHLMLLSMPDGKVVTEAKLRGAYDRARVEAAKKAREQGKETLAQDIEAMWLRDLRKMAANLAESLEEASRLLQHSSVNVTRLHYRTKAEKVKPVR